MQPTYNGGTQDVTLYQGNGGMQEITVFRPPEEVLAEAQRAASALKNVVAQTKAVIKLGESEHLKAEAWQTLGHFYGLTARIRETKLVQFGDVRGFEAYADLIHVASGRIVSSAEAMCLSDEEKWSTRSKYAWKDGKRVKVGEESVPLFQLRSMAQTRAISKVHANALKWVVVLAGYNPTPAEEVDGQNLGDGPDSPGEVGKISEKQASRIWGIAHSSGKTKDQVIAILHKHNFQTAKDVTTDKYEAICAEVEAK